MSHQSGPLSEKLQGAFLRWFALSVLTLVVVVATGRAFAADVFIDEGDGDFEQVTPVATPDSTAQGGGSLDLDSDFKSGASSTAVTEPAPIVDTTGADPMTAEKTPELKLDEPDSVKPQAKGPKAGFVKSAGKSAPKAAKAEKKDSKKSAKAAPKKSAVKAAKTSKKSAAKSASAKKSGKKKSASVSKSSRKVASTVKFAGGMYATTSRECAMESSPGAGDSVGTSKSNRKLWVEDAGDAGYWKVYNKGGTAAYLSRICF